jgi:hypothetical protein
VGFFSGVFSVWSGGEFFFAAYELGLLGVYLVVKVLHFTCNPSFAKLANEVNNPNRFSYL